MTTTDAEMDGIVNGNGTTGERACEVMQMAHAHLTAAPLRSKPVRIQRKRTKGWRLPPAAIVVTRPTQYGNRYVIGTTVRHVDGKDHEVTNAAVAVQLYREWLEWQIAEGYPPPIEDLRGHDLACWCRLDQPCHADVLLELANREQP